MRFRFERGLIDIFWMLWGVQIYYPIVRIDNKMTQVTMSTSFSVLYGSWAYDWAFGFRILGFGFGIGYASTYNPNFKILRPGVDEYADRHNTGD